MQSSTTAPTTPTKRRSYGEKATVSHGSSTAWTWFMSQEMYASSQAQITTIARSHAIFKTLSSRKR